MLRVECESCKAPYQVDERRIPPTGLRMRCPKCTHTFVVMPNSGEPVPPPDPHSRPSPNSPVPAPSGAGGGAAGPAAGRKMQATMLGVGSGLSKPPPRAGADLPVAPPRDSEVGLPAAKPVKPRSPSAPATAEMEADLPSVAAPDSKGDLPVAKADSKPDLPAAKAAAKPDSAPALPEVKKGPAAKPPVPTLGKAPPKPPPPAPKVAAKPAAPTAADFGAIDLPVKATPAAGLSVDLPARKAADADLPSKKGDVAGLPMTLPKAPARVGTPSEIDFGEIDLPAVGAVGLPSPGPKADLPVAASALPAVASALPSVADALPARADALPSPQPSLPQRATPRAIPASPAAPPAAPRAASPAAPAAPPAAAPVAEEDPFAGGLELGLASLPPAAPPAEATPVAPAVAVPAAAPAMDAAAGDDDFGELDLPPAAGVADSFAAAPKPLDLGGFGELDLPPPPPLDLGSLPPPAAAPPSRPSPPPPRPSSSTEAGVGTAFGEVDLATGTSEGAAIDTEEPLIGTGGGEAALGDGAKAEEEVIPTAAAPKPRDAAAGPKKRGRGRLVALIGLGVLAAGGAALELSPMGAYGRHTITDLVKAGDYDRRVQEIGTASRKALATDLHAEARGAADRAAAAHAEMPRARALTAYVAFLECATQVRFGAAADRLPRVKGWLTELAANPETKYLAVAQAAYQAANGDTEKALRALEAASRRDTGDPIQEDVANLRGELSLVLGEGKAALEAFQKAEAAGKTARAAFGRARAHARLHENEAAGKALDETLKLSPKHPEARILRATLAWERKDEAAALADLKAVLEGDVQEAASERAKSSAHALRGWIHFARGRSAEARASFDASLKLDGRNVSALVGQGEVLFSDARYTEALTRFETAVQTDPTSVLAVVSAAKAKLPLERLQDAKLQLAAARAKFPKDWRVAHWLGRAEQALGNKAVAEKEYLASVELLDKSDPDAVAPYVGLALLYAGQGKTKEADQKLAEARAKLPDTAPLRRALGEMAAQQGRFDEAVREFRAALEKDPGDLGTRFKLGVTLRRMRKMAEASAEFDKIVAADKDYPGLALERGLLYEESGDIDKALEQFQSALAKAPDDLDLKLRVGASYAAIGRPGDAIPILRGVLEKRGTSAEVNHFLGRALFLQSGPAQAEAMRFLKRAVELDPNRAEYHLYVAWAANNAIPAQMGLAKESSEKALALDKLLADGYWQRGLVLRKTGAVDDAIVDLKRALELKPSRIDAYAGLAECYEDKNDTAQAMANWQRAIAADASKPDWRYRFGKLLFERGSVGDAAKHILFAVDEGEKADPRPGWLPKAEFLAGEVLKKTGKRAEAVERYRRFLEIAPTNSPERKEATQALTELGAAPKR